MLFFVITVISFKTLQLLGRVFNILRENNPELAGDRRRTVMRPPQVLREGTKKTVFVNFMDLCKTYVISVQITCHHTKRLCTPPPFFYWGCLPYSASVACVILQRLHTCLFIFLMGTHQLLNQPIVQPQNGSPSNFCCKMYYSQLVMKSHV